MSFHILSSLKQGSLNGFPVASKAESYPSSPLSMRMHLWHLCWVECKTLWNDGMMIQHWNRHIAYIHKGKKRQQFSSVEQLTEKEGLQLNAFFRSITNLSHLYFAFYVCINSNIAGKKLSLNHSYAENFKWWKCIES